MKKIFILLLLCGTLGACKKGLFSPKEQLPPATQVGANTAGCLVDGEVFLGQKARDTRLNYLDGQDFALWISKEVDEVSYSVGIHMEDTPLEIGQTYQLMTGYRGTHTGLYHIGTNSPPNVGYYLTDSTITGEIIITHHSFDSAFLSGTFWFDAANSEGKIVEIREGRFDMDY